MRKIECTPMAHCDNVCGLGQTVIFLAGHCILIRVLLPSFFFSCVACE
jgi:hypothetical protein